MAGDVLDKIHNVLNIVNNEFKYTRNANANNARIYLLAFSYTPYP